MDTTPAPLWVQYLAQLAERAAMTYLQAFLAALVASTFFDQLDWSVAAAAAVATIPAGISVALAAVTAASPSDHWPPLAQGAFRVLRTWAATFLGFLIAAPMTLDVVEMRTLVASAFAAAGAAFLAAVKAEVATHVGNHDTAALLPARFDFALAA